MPKLRELPKARLFTWTALFVLAGLALVPAMAKAQTWQERAGAQRPDVALQLEAAPEPKEITGAGQDWRAELEAERARNADRIRAIDEQAAPLGRELNQVMANTKQHNDNPPPPPADPSNRAQVQAYNAKVDVYNQEANRLNTRRAQLVNILTPLARESDALIARNKQIDSMLARYCSQPTFCNSNADCKCGFTCGQDPGGTLGNMRLCQPSR